MVGVRVPVNIFLFDEMEVVQSQYLACRPVKSISWQGLDWLSLDVDSQLQLMKATVLHPWSLQYPASLKYRETFLKHVITQLETVGVEVCDEVYEEYTCLLSQNVQGQSDRCFKTYLLVSMSQGHGESNSIHLRESTNLISQGTTGLRTWQAAQHLAEWCLEHSDVFQNKSVLELGSGLGLTGLVVCRYCSPQRFTFSDCHPDVLGLLAENIDRNLGSCMCKEKETETEPTGSKLCDRSATPAGANCVNQSEHATSDATDISGVQGSYGPSWQQDNCKADSQRFVSCHRHVASNGMVRMLDLDWEAVSDQELAVIGADVDIFLAADVVYDTSIIPALVRVLKMLLSSSSRGTAYVASTVRNEATRDSFLQAIDDAGICRETVPGPQTQLFHYDREVPIQILRLTCQH